MITMFIVSMFVNLFIKLLVWFIKQNVEGGTLSAKMRDKFMEVSWLTNRWQEECGRAGLPLSGKQPAEWGLSSRLNVWLPLLGLVAFGAFAGAISIGIYILLRFTDGL